MVGHLLHYPPAVKAIKEMVLSGRLGKITTFIPMARCEATSSEGLAFITSVISNALAGYPLGKYS